MNTLEPKSIAAIEASLKRAFTDFKEAYPCYSEGEQPHRQPVHTVYGGAHLFKADSIRKLGKIALAALEENAPDPAGLARTLGYRDEQAFASAMYERIIAKLEHEPIEDYRVDFEDGYGARLDDEEDHHARFVAAEMARACREGTLPRFVGIRLKPFSEDLFARSIRTLDLFMTTLAREGQGKIPEGFRVTLPKVSISDQVSGLGEALTRLEKALGLSDGQIRVELMIETPQALIDRHGRFAIPALIAAGRGRVDSVHLGPYDYTGALDITAAFQDLLHPACDFARHILQVSLAGTGVMISDGASHLIPVGKDRHAIHQAWRHSYQQIRHSLEGGFYQGWDLHPAQIPVRYAAVFSFFRESLPQASSRLRSFMDRAAQASLAGQTFEDRASAQGLLNFFLRGLGCGALSEAEVLEAGLTAEEIRSGSFARIMRQRGVR